MTICMPLPCLEKSVTGSIEPASLQWIATSSPGLEPWLMPAIRSLAEFEQLGVGWDGHGSPPPTHAAVAKAGQLLTSIRSINLPAPNVFPFSGGGIGIQWEAGGRELQMSVYPDAVVNYLTAVGDDEDSVHDGTFTADWDSELNRLVRRLIEG